VGMDGMHAMYFTGTKSSGYAVLALKNGMIAEADSMDRVLDGIYERVGNDDADSSVRFNL